MFKRMYECEKRMMARNPWVIWVASSFIILLAAAT